MASNQSGSALADSLTAPAGEAFGGQWLPKQRSSALDTAPVATAPAPADPRVPGAAFEPFGEPPAVTDPGELLRLRIIEHVRSTRAAAEAAEAAREAAARAKEAAAQKVRDTAARKQAEEAARLRAEAEAEAERRRAEAEAAEAAERERVERLAAGYVRPVTSCTLTEGFGGASSPWAVGNTGQDFAVPTGTPAMAIHTGTITSAGWAGSFGYRIVLTLGDGTQLWYCHLSSMVKTAGPVTTGDVIGRVGATGSASVPFLHLEVRPGGAAPVDPVEWLRERGVEV